MRAETRMIVRINQIEVAQAEQASGWPVHGLTGPIRFRWPVDTNAFEILVLSRDEQTQPLQFQFRQQQVRQLIPIVLSAVRERGEEVVIRLDGAMRTGELVGGFAHLTESHGYGRYSIAHVDKLNFDPDETAGSVRFQLLPHRIGPLCMDATIGLERSVRMRLIGVPEELVNPLLDTHDLDDERWKEILPQAGFMLSTSTRLRSIEVITPRLDASQIKERLLGQLGGAKPLSQEVQRRDR